MVQTEEVGVINGLMNDTVQWRLTSLHKPSHSSLDRERVLQRNCDIRYQQALSPRELQQQKQWQWCQGPNANCTFLVLVLEVNLVLRAIKQVCCVCLGWSAILYVVFVCYFVVVVVVCTCTWHKTLFFTRAQLYWD